MSRSGGGRVAEQSGGKKQQRGGVGRSRCSLPHGQRRKASRPLFRASRAFQPASMPLSVRLVRKSISQQQTPQAEIGGPVVADVRRPTASRRDGGSLESQKDPAQASLRRDRACLDVLESGGAARRHPSVSQASQAAASEKAVSSLRSSWVATPTKAHNVQGSAEEGRGGSVGDGNSTSKQCPPVMSRARSANSRQ